MKLIKVQPVIDIIALALQSVFVENEPNGVSVLLIANPETAKTSSIFKFQNLDFVSYYDEITQKKLIDEFLPLAKDRQIRTLLIPDLINCIEKQKATREQFLQIIKSGIDDTGITRISTYHKQLHYHKLIEGIKFNMITAITKGTFLKYQKRFKQSGLLSRFLPFSYDYPIDKLKLILNHIEGKRTIPDVTIPHITKRDIAIPQNPELFKEFEYISTKIGLDYGGYGLRAQISLQRLAKANAILRKDTSVKKEDIAKVVNLSRWMNFKFNPL